jgi:hypothetical protein
VVTAFYAVGLAALAYAAHVLAEAALWPLLSKQTLTIDQMETYVEASRGSVASTPSALFASRSFDSFVILIFSAIITLAPLAGAPVVGYVYDQGNVSVAFESLYQPGGGIGKKLHRQIGYENIH